MNHGLDTDERVCFYEQDFYVLSNFSAFTLMWNSIRFDTSEAAYHWEKFSPQGDLYDARRVAVRHGIRDAISAHVVFKIAEENLRFVRPDWNDVRVDIMRQILRAKIEQHEYVRCKLLATGDRMLVENSWRDSFLGEGPNQDGMNMLGVLWMELRAGLRGAL